MSQSIIEKIERFDLANPATGQIFRISVYNPVDAADPATLPILFVTDADYFFGSAAEMVGLQSLSRVIRPCILVGIGYGSDLAETARLRVKDLTLSVGDAWRSEVGWFLGTLSDETGDAADLLKYIIDVLTPDIRRRHPAASGERMLFGASLGGLFATLALYSRPDAFSGFIIGNPALYWNDFAVLKSAGEFPSKLAGVQRKPRVFIAAGSKEADKVASVPESYPITVDELNAMLEKFAVVPASQQLALDLRAEGLDAEYQLFDGEGHQSVIPAAMSRGVSFLLGVGH